MKLRKSDRESLRAAMPGDVLTVAGAGCDEAFSVTWIETGEWVLFHGTVVARAPDRVTERILEVRRGCAATITDQLDRLGAEFPLPEQVSGATDFPTPRDIFWLRCLDRMPGELLDSPEYARRVAFSLVRARTGWRVFCSEEMDADRLEYGDFLNAIYTDEEIEIRPLRWWRGVAIGNRNGIVADADIRSVLRHIGVDPDTVTALPDDEEESEHEKFRAVFEMAQDLATWPSSSEGDSPRSLPVEVIHLGSPLEERLERSRSVR